MTTLNNHTSPITRLMLSSVRARMLLLMEQGNPDAYQLGWLYNYVEERQLAQRAGFKDAADFFNKEVRVISPTMLTACACVARAFPGPLKN